MGFPAHSDIDTSNKFVKKSEKNSISCKQVCYTPIWLLTPSGHLVSKMPDFQETWASFMHHKYLGYIGSRYSYAKWILAICLSMK